MKIKLILLFLLTSLLFSEDNLIQNEYIKLTPEELIFINKTKIKVISSNTWAPINMDNENHELSGIAIDFWDLIQKRANLNAEIKVVNKWNDVLNAIKSKKADITLGTIKDAEKKDYAIFTMPYISFPIAIATLFDKRFIPDGSFLEGKKVAVGENYSSYLVMKKAYPKIDFVLVKNSKEALKLLSAGEVYAVIDILPVIAHLISINGYSNLKISGTTEEKIDIAFMIRKDYPELKQIIDRHIALLTKEDKDLITREWLTVKFDKRIIDKELIINLSITILAIVLLFLYRQRSVSIHKEKLEFLSNTDSLTGLKNRRMIDKVFNEIQNKKFSVILLDIDNFKKVNDDFGHLIGDEILIKISKLLKYNVNSNDIIGRWGGEEFIIICKNTNIEEAEKLALRLKNLIENENFKVRQITASFGITEAKNNQDLKDILADADKALYKAKENGRNQIVLNSN